MTHSTKLALSASTVAALVFTAIAAQAQLSPPAPKAQPAAPPAPAAKAQPAPAPAPAAPAAKKAAAPATACKGLDEKGCGGNADCTWVSASKRKDGKEIAAYCRSKPKSVKAAPKKVDAKPATATAPAAPAVPGTTRAAPAAPAAPAAKAPPAATK